MVHPPAVLDSSHQNFILKAKGSVPLKAGADIIAAWDAKRSVLVHDVNIASAASDFPCADAFDGQFHFRFVIKGCESLVAVKCRLVCGCGCSHRNRNAAAGLLLNGEIGACLTALEQQLVVLDFRCSDDSCLWAADTHLCDV